MKKIGLLDGQTIQAVIFAKQLRKEGYKVILFCDAKLSYGYHTKYAHSKVLSPSTEHEINQFHKFFLDYLEHHELDVVIPMNDYSAKYLSENKEVLKGKVALSIPDISVFMTGYDKNKLMTVCNENSFPHPKTIDISLLNRNVVKDDFNFPALIKPNETTGARGFMRVNSFKELWENYDAIFNEFGNCHLQEFIPQGGRQFKVQILIKGSEVLASSVIEKHRYYPVNGGSSCFNNSIINDSLVETCQNVLTKIGWEGFADFDLIEDIRNGRILIMEINPRVPACIKTSVVSGIDFPNAIVDLTLKIPVKKYDYKPGKYLRYFSMDLLWLLTSKNKSLKNWTKKMFSSNHYLQDGDLLDPMPFIIGTYSGVVKQLNPKFRANKKGMN